ncbi:TonB-dependent receptor [soil metagenome]
MHFRFIISALFLLTLKGFSQNGTISGTITEQSNGEIVIGAVVIVDSFPKYGCVTDFDGKYQLKVPEGNYTIKCHYTGYATVTINDVNVSAGKTTSLDFILTSRLDSVVEIYGQRPTGTISAVLDTIHKGNVAADGLDKKTISGIVANNAGDVAKKIPGVTLVDNRFIIVRGLSERYNTVLLNNVLAPSAESDVKAFSFDLIPSSMIDNFLIFKSPSPELPGEFAGGAIRITTTDIPDHNALLVGYAGGFRSGTTMQPFSMNKGGSGDKFAIGASSRALPNDFPSNVHDIVSDPLAVKAAGRSLTNDWNYETYNAPIDTKFNLGYEYRYSKEKIQFGNITALNYSNTNSYKIINRLDYNSYDSLNHQSDTMINYQDASYVNDVRLAFVQNNAFRFGHGGSQHITFKNLFNQMGSNETSLRTGSSMENGEYRKEYSYHYSQRTLYTGQLSGLHEFNNKNTKLDWTAAYSLSRRMDPDWKRARYSKDFAAPAEDPYYAYIGFSAEPFFLGRIFINMNEEIKAGTVNYSQNIVIGKNDAEKKSGYSFTFKAGAYLEQKIREFSVRNLGYAEARPIYFNQAILTMPLDSIFQSANINDTTGIKIAEDTKASDQYAASNFLEAGYVMFVTPLGHFKGRTDETDHDRIRISWGMRVEHNIQQLNSNRRNGDTVIVNNNITSLLPSVNLAYNINERMLARFAYGKTLNRPEFREIAPLYFYDFISNAINVGNDSLKTCTVDNFDVRWEFYPRSGENITFGAFYKKFTNPIEKYFVPGVGTGGTRSFTWGNAPEANNWGMEIELRKKLDSVNVPVIRNIGVVANAAWIHSEIVLSTTNTGASYNTRPMMGQSPWIINAGLFYQNDSCGFQINAMYNVIGPRVVIVGIPGIPEVYEMPRHQIDLAFIKTFGKRKNIDVRLNISDLLNQETILLQDANEDGKLDPKTDQRMEYYKNGTYFTFGINVRLLEPKQN